MVNPVRGIWQLTSGPNRKFLGTFILLLLIAGIPLTVFVAQQQQDIRQRASNTTTTCYRNVTDIACANEEDCIAVPTVCFSGPVPTGLSLTPIIDEPATSPTATPTPTSAPIGGSTGGSCLQVLTRARNTTTNACQFFPNSCLPEGWVADSSCTITAAITLTPTPTPTGGTCQCDLNAVVENSCGSGTTATCTGKFSCACQVPIATPTVFTTLPPRPTISIVPTATPRPTATPTPTGCYYKQVQCIQAPCPPILVCPTGVSIAPTATPVPTGTKFAMTVVLHGIGVGGDNVTPTSGGNKTPIRQQHGVTIEVYNASDTLVLTKTGTLAYQAIPAGTAAPLPNQGKFVGTVDMGTTLATGNYTIKVKPGRYLRRRIPGIIRITAGTTVTLPEVAFVAGDINNDNRLNILDYNGIMGCYNVTTATAKCTDQLKKATDLNDDGNVNQYDYNLFLRELSVQAGE